MGFHWPELFIIAVVALLIFGPKRLPEMGSAIGKTFKEFKKSLSELSESTQTENVTPEHQLPAALPETTRTPVTQVIPEVMQTRN